MDWNAHIRAALAADRSGARPSLGKPRDWQPREADADVVEELSQHAAAVYERARAEGRSTAEASLQVDALIEAWRRDASTLSRRPRRPVVIEPPAPAKRWLAGIVQDARYGLRLLKRERGFALVAILTIALGVGATTTLFSVTYGVLLKPLPWPDADRLVRVSESRKGHEPRVRGTITNGTLIAWRVRPSTIEDIGGWRNVTTTATVGNSDTVRVQIAAITPSLFTVLKARPLRGRLFEEEDGRTGGGPSGVALQAPFFSSRDVIILSYGLWQEWCGGREDAVGTGVRVGGRLLTVVGVMPKNFAFPDRETRAWTPWSVVSVLGDGGVRRVSIFSALARLRPGVTAAQAAAEGTSRAQSAPDPGLAAVAMFGGNGPAEIAAMPAIDMMTAEVRPALLVLLAAVILLLATATANVASLQMARATTRRREIAIRAAIGAGAGRLARQLVVESAILGLAGGVLGLSLAAALHRALPSVLPADFPRMADVAIDWRVVAFAVAVTTLASIACGLLPALHAGRVNLVESLSDAGSAPVGGGMRSPTVRARALIMAAQVAIACVLLIGAALLSRSFTSLLHADRGYDQRNLLTARIPMPGVTMERRTQMLDALAGRLQSMPGVREVAYGNALPLFTSGGFKAFKMRSPADPSVEVDVNVMQRVVSPGFFAALGLRLTAGRALTDTDTMTSPEVIVVNRSFAARYLGPKPLGAIVPSLGMCRGDNDRWQVVGIVEDMRQGSVADPPQPELFMPYRQVGCAAAVPDPVIVVRAEDNPLPYAATLRALVREQSPALVPDAIMTMEDRVMANLAKPRLYAIVLAGFSVFALVIAGVGLFGVLSYSVAQRSREIGVRTALGAQPADVVRLVLGQFAAILVGGLVAGVWLAFAATRSLTAVLYGVNPHDLASFVAVPLALAVVAVMACIVPARRAARIDPLRALRVG
jgi:putative ABC transport system permease protein